MRPWIIFPKALDVELVRSYRSYAQPMEMVHSEGGPGKVKRWIHHGDLPFIPILTHFMSQANRHFRFDVTGIDYLQWAEYDVDCSLGLHTDTYPMVDAKEPQRKISFTLQLTDGRQYDGGDLELYIKPMEPEPEEALREIGSLCFFPSTTPHWVTPVTRGVREALVGWFVGPAWR